MLDYESHAKLQYYFSKINHFYLENPELWQNDGWWDGFQWIDADNADESVITYRRIAKGKESEEDSEIIVAINFTPVKRDDFRLYVPEAGEYHEIFNSDKEEFGGYGDSNEGTLFTYDTPGEKLPHAVNVTLPPMSAVMFRRTN